MTFSAPPSILIIGSGVFGLSLAKALTQRPAYNSTKITLLDRSICPSPDGSSVDSSRIIRADYSDPAYASLASRAQDEWRDKRPGKLGGDGRYTESGLVLVADCGTPGEEYVKASWENVKNIMAKASDPEGGEELPGKAQIAAAVGTAGGNGDWGYVNRRSGWADAEAAMCWLREQVEATGRIDFVHGEVVALLRAGTKVTGARLKDSSCIEADLVIVATGAWSGGLVDLRGRAVATGQVLAYCEITAAEQAKLDSMPVLLNMSTGMFVIPPKNGILKVARHGFGYSNPKEIPHPHPAAGHESETIEVSLPRTKRDDPEQCIPAEGEAACRQALREMVPQLAERPFAYSRVCWYTDTPRGDFLITYHPEMEGLFLATGGSGHGFKFLPVIGDAIADTVEGHCPPEFKEKWAWPQEQVENVVTQDGSRGGLPGLILDIEMGKSRL